MKQPVCAYPDSVMVSAARFALSRFNFVLVWLLLAVPCSAADAPLQTIDWPSSGKAVVRFTFGKFKALPGTGNLRSYLMDTTAENVSAKRIPSARFNVYLYDKAKVRVGQSVVEILNLGPGGVAKFETSVATSGEPLSVSVEDVTTATRSLSITVNSTPQGATLAVDGNAVGVTPRMISVEPGHHTLVITKEGFASGTIPLDIGRDDASGGTVNFELGTPASDSIELRDGTVLYGDLVSISGMDVEIRVGDSIQHMDRNKIKRVLFIPRNVPAPDVHPSPAPQ
jgi:hypothetical protein